MNKGDNSSFSDAKDVSKTKKRLLIILLVCGVALAVLLLASLLIDRITENKKFEEITKNLDYKFATADFNENIYEDSDYMELIENGFLYFTDASNNLTVGYEKEEAEKYGEDVVFLTKYIYTVIEGNADEYNAMFSDLYYKDNDPLERFTMQKIYDVYLTKVLESNITEDGLTYRTYRYTVEYKILDNNGTFRNDIGTGSRKQYFTITDRSGELLIDAVGVNLN